MISPTIRPQLFCLPLSKAVIFCLFIGSLISTSLNTHGAENTRGLGDAGIDIPLTLQPWQDWVLRDQPEHGCTRIAQTANNKRCVWPGILEIATTDSGARFQQNWQVLAKQQWIYLPGSREHWPHDVTLNGKTAIVVDHKGKPAIQLVPGNYNINGQLSWSRTPQYLTIDANTGLITLTRNGSKIAAETDAQSRVWLRADKTSSGPAQSNTLKIEVFRLLSDDIPLRLQTEVRITVAGEPREIVVGQLLPANAEALSFNTPLPARIEADGRLRIQARPGEWRVNLTARYLEPAMAFTMTQLDSQLGDQWPDQEIWSFRANPNLRGVKVSGPAAIDPSQIDLPKGFGNLPTYLMSPDTELTLAEDYRGDATPAANQLTLQRSLWLDFDGGGATARDQISGALTHDWRLRSSPELALGRVSAQGQPQVVTRMPGESGHGIEVRQANVSVEALSRIEPLSALAATGWQHNFDRVSLQLNLPPGWQLWHASGPDRIASSWLSRWDLWDLFLCLLIVGATLRILDWRWALVSAATLALTYHEPGAPLAGWVILVAAIPLLRVIPQGKLRRWLRGIALGVLLILVIVALAFAVQQIRRGLYPQLEQERAINSNNYASRYDSFSSSDESLSVESDMAEGAMTPRLSRLESKTTSAPEPRKRYRPTDNVQTGPGEPTWNWRQVNLSWSGPVRAEAALKLYLSPPWLTRSLKFIQVALVGLLIYGLARPLLSAGGGSSGSGSFGSSGGSGSTSSSSSSGSSNRSGSGTGTATASGLLPMLLLALVMGSATLSATLSPPTAAADFPPQKLLEELKTELLKPPTCTPQCASLLQGQLNVQGNTFTLRLRVATDTAVAIPLPLGNNWRAAALLIDGKSAALARGANQLWAQVEPGAHDLLLRGDIVGDSINFTFALPLHQVAVSAPGWQIQGVSDGQLRGKTLQLRKQEQTQAKDTLLPDPIKPFVRVERVLSQDIDWQLTTTVTRIAPQAGTINLKIPLLAGESMVSDHKVSGDREVLVTLPGGQHSFQWRSVLEPTAELQLSAPETNQWIELWRVQASPRWHISGEGLPAVKSPGSPNPLWQPWPGETLTLSSVQPEPVPGPTTTVESAVVEHTPGARSAALSLSLKIRASLGGDYRLELPVPGELQRIEIDGNEQTRPKEGNEVVLPLRPGLQTIKIDWELAQGIDQFVETPAFILPTPANNIDIKLHLPSDRWPLFLQGPDIGPAMLYWGVLFVIIGVAISLGIAVKRFGLSIPVRTWQWLLLTIGISTVSTAVSVPVVLWFFAMEWRRRNPMPTTMPLFNLTQLALILLSIIALGCLFTTIPQSLLSSPEMQVTGNGSSNFYYQWYQDHSANTLPQGMVFSVPLWVYRITMLLWSLWIVFALLNWIKWGWQCLSAGKFWDNGPSKAAKVEARAEGKG